MIFCQIDKGLLAIIKKEAKGRVVVDCGAGEGLLGSLMDKVISLDILPGGIADAGKTLSKVLPLDCTKFKFPDSCLPVFIRPCHSGFPEETIENNLERFETVLYVSEPKNIERDLGSIPKNFEMKRIGKWVGSDGEFCYRIIVNEKKAIDMKTLVLVKQFIGASETDFQISWKELGGKHADGSQILLASNGFSWCILGSKDKILETVKAKSWDVVNTIEQRAKTTHYQDLLKDSTDKSLKMGWLSPDGTMHYCKYTNHIEYVHTILESDVPTIEAKGWIHIFADMKHLHPNSGKRLTQAQARTAREELELEIFDDDVAYQ